MVIAWVTYTEVTLINNNGSSIHLVITKFLREFQTGFVQRLLIAEVRKENIVNKIFQKVLFS